MAGTRLLIQTVSLLQLILLMVIAVWWGLCQNTLDYVCHRPFLDQQGRRWLNSQATEHLLQNISRRLELIDNVSFVTISFVIDENNSSIFLKIELSQWIRKQHHYYDNPDDSNNRRWKWDIREVEHEDFVSACADRTIHDLLFSEKFATANHADVWICETATTSSTASQPQLVVAESALLVYFSSQTSLTEHNLDFLFKHLLPSSSDSFPLDPELNDPFFRRRRRVLNMPLWIDSASSAVSYLRDDDNDNDDESFSPWRILEQLHDFQSRLLPCVTTAPATTPRPKYTYLHVDAWSRYLLQNVARAHFVQDDTQVPIILSHEDENILHEVDRMYPKKPYQYTVHWVLIHSQRSELPWLTQHSSRVGTIAGLATEEIVVATQRGDEEWVVVVDLASSRCNTTKMRNTLCQLDDAWNRVSEAILQHCLSIPSSFGTHLVSSRDNTDGSIPWLYMLLWYHRSFRHLRSELIHLFTTERQQLLHLPRSVPVQMHIAREWEAALSLASRAADVWHINNEGNNYDRALIMMEQAIHRLQSLQQSFDLLDPSDNFPSDQNFAILAPLLLPLLLPLLIGLPREIIRYRAHVKKKRETTYAKCAS